MNARKSVFLYQIFMNSTRKGVLLADYYLGLCTCARIHQKKWQLSNAMISGLGSV